MGAELIPPVSPGGAILVQRATQGQLTGVHRSVPLPEGQKHGSHR